MPACFYPILLKDATSRVPCGKCVNCKKKLISSWSFRLLQEDKVSDSSHFITLTYAPDTVPITPKGFASLSKRDCQLFIKRLRTAHVRSSFPNISRKPIKYYFVGEYGGKFGRPHYHIILFNADLRCIEGAWRNGTIHVGKVAGASIGYCLKYISKKTFTRKHNYDDRCAEFSLMSKGLGSSYLTKQMIRWHKADLSNRVYVNIEGGKKATMARYYKLKLYDDQEKRIIGDTIAQKMHEKSFVPIEKWRNVEEAKKAAKRLESKKLKKTKNI